MKDMLRMKVTPVMVLCLMGGVIQGAAETLTIEQCVERALARNAQLLAARQMHEAAEARVMQARAIPQPSLDYDSDMQPGLLDLADSGETYLGVSQTIELPGRRALRVKIAREGSAEVSEAVESERRDLVFEVESAFNRMLLAREQLGYAQQNLELSKDFEELATVRYEAGDVAQVEILRARVELARAESELRQAETQVELAAARLDFLIGGSGREQLEVTGDLHREPVTVELTGLIAMAQAARPEVRALRHSLAREELTEKQARRSLAPDLDLGLARHRIDGEGSFWDVTLSIPLPLFWQQYRGEVAEARANQRAANHQLHHLEQTIALEVREAHRAAVAARNQIELFDEELLIEAREVYDMYLFSFREGGIGGIELISARQSLLAARTSYAVALYDHAIAVAALERAVGQDLKGAHQ